MHLILEDNHIHIHPSFLISGIFCAVNYITVIQVNQSHQGRYSCTPYNRHTTAGSSGDMEVSCTFLGLSYFVLVYSWYIFL